MSVVKTKINTETETEMTINNKQLRSHVTENIGLIEQQKYWWSMTDPPQRKTSLPKGPHSQKKKTLQSSPLSTSPLQKKRGELVSPVKRQLRRTNRNNIPGGERKEK